MRYGCIFLGALTLCVIGCGDEARTEDGRSVGLDTYVFPLRPGMAEWSRLETFEDKLATMQLPEEDLETMSTTGLLDSYVGSPLFHVVTRGSNDLQRGFERAQVDFNGIGELVQRPDVGRVLLARYRALDPSAIDPSWTLERQGEHEAAITNIEMLLAQPLVVARLDERERESVVTEGLAKARTKRMLVEIYGFQGIATTALLVGRTLAAMGVDPLATRATQDAKLRGFLDGSDWSDDSAMHAVLEYAQRYATEKE